MTNILKTMEQLVLLADSGSTKTDWAIINPTDKKAVPFRVFTQGINPFHQSEEAIRSVLKDELLSHMGRMGEKVGRIRYYGSGVTPEKEPFMCRVLAETFPEATSIEAHGDLLGAARALCGNNEGLACILGTGSNSCFYDGSQIVKNTPPLGYVLGDEGSGAVIGRRLLNALYKGLLGEDVKVLFESWAGVNMAEAVNHVYRQPLPNRWLASLTVFVADNIKCPGMEQLVVDNFRDFIRLNVNPYDRHDLPLNAVGSIAYFFRAQLDQAGRAEGYRLGLVMKSPMEGLIQVEQLR